MMEQITNVLTASGNFSSAFSYTKQFITEITANGITDLKVRKGGVSGTVIWQCKSDGHYTFNGLESDFGDLLYIEITGTTPTVSVVGGKGRGYGN